MKKFLVILIVLIICNELYSQPIRFSNCTAFYINNDLEISLKIYNLDKNDNSEEYESFFYSESILIPYSDWAFYGTTSDDILKYLRWSWINEQLINSICFVQENNLEVPIPQVTFCSDYSQFKMNYLPYFENLDYGDSLEIKFKYSNIDSMFNGKKDFKIFIKIPYIKADDYFEIEKYRDISKTFTKNDSLHINLNKQNSKSVVKRNYKYYSKVKIDEALRRMLRIAIKDHLLICNCNIQRSN